jgi:aminopeptidase N
VHPRGAPGKPDAIIARVAAEAPSQDSLITWGPLPPGVQHELPVRGFQVQHQVTHIRVDWARRVLVGTTSLRLSAGNARVSDVTLDAEGMVIGAARGARGSATPFDYDGRTLTLHLATAVLPRGVTTLDIDYETAPTSSGLAFDSTARAVWTVGVPGAVRRWVPTVDLLAERASWDLFVTTRVGEQALGNGLLAGSKRTAAGEVEWHWVQDARAPLASMAFAIGSRVVLQDLWRGVPLGYWTSVDAIEATWQSLGRTPRMIELFTQRTGAVLPAVKYDQFLVPGPRSAAAASASFATLSDSLVSVSAADDHVATDVVIARTLARQWFGGLVTARDWASLWLVEALPELLAQVWVESGRSADDAALLRAASTARAIDADRRARRPLDFDRWVTDPSELLETGHARDRGVAVLQLLRKELGDSVFWSGIARLVGDKAGASVATDDLRASLEAASGRALGEFFAQWVQGSGVPAFRVRWAYDSVARNLVISARQVQPTDSLTGLFAVDVPVDVWTDSGRVQRVVAVRSESTELTIPLNSPPRALRWNSGGWVPEVIDFPRPTEMLTYQLQHDSDVLGRLEAIELLAKRVLDERARAALAATVSSDSSQSVRARAAAVFASVRSP